MFTDSPTFKSILGWTARRKAINNNKQYKIVVPPCTYTVSDIPDCSVLLPCGESRLGKAKTGVVYA